MNCNGVENAVEGRFVWVIKDQDGNFAKRIVSIGKSGKQESLYIGFRSFGPECRAYTSEAKAIEALAVLDEMKVISGFDIKFHIECVNLNIILKNSKENLDVYLVLRELNSTLEFPLKILPILTEAI